MPEDLYGMRPGAQPEVRTFAQLIGHLANYNYRWCSDAKAEKNPMEETDFEKLTAKADLVKALNGALTYCDSAYAALSDSNSMDMVQGTRDDGTKVPVLRISRLIVNLAHNNEHYGNLVTYMRIKSIVPPLSLRAALIPAQSADRGPGNVLSCAATQLGSTLAAGRIEHGEPFYGKLRIVRGCSRPEKRTI